MLLDLSASGNPQPLLEADHIMEGEWLLEMKCLKKEITRSSFPVNKVTLITIGNIGKPKLKERPLLASQQVAYYD